jgi:hypothetical protein
MVTPTLDRASSACKSAVPFAFHRDPFVFRFALFAARLDLLVRNLSLRQHVHQIARKDHALAVDALCQEEIAELQRVALQDQIRKDSPGRRLSLG